MTHQGNAASIQPGLTLCAACRSRDAVVTVDPDERWARPLCFDCVEDLLERENALHIHRGAVELIQRAHREPVRPLPAPLVDWETADHSKLLELRAQWRAYEAAAVRTLAGAARCWAIVADGSRCVRDEQEQGLCETHLVRGARVPGLGWRGDEPQGPVTVRRERVTA